MSDGPEWPRFRQILSLQKEIQTLDKKVDLFILMDKKVSFNGKQLNKELRPMELLRQKVNENKYATVVVSLTLANFETLFSLEREILDFVERLLPQTSMFVFGAKSQLNKIEAGRASRIFLYPRRGVSKITKELKEDLIDYVRNGRTPRR